MSVIMFDFSNSATSGQFSMSKACQNPSSNPVPVPTPPCIYIISNQNTNPPSVYVGYAKDAQHRWKGRAEAFHCFNVTQAYGKNIKCGWTIPRISNQQFNQNAMNFAPNAWQPVPSGNLKGQDAAEHLLLRCVINGALGAGVVSTNTQLRNTSFQRDIKFYGLTHVLLYFGNKFAFPHNNQIVVPLP